MQRSTLHILLLSVNSVMVQTVNGGWCWGPLELAGVAFIARIGGTRITGCAI